MNTELPSSLAWRIPGREEVTLRRRIFQRTLLTSVAFMLVLLWALPQSWWGLGLVVGLVAGGLLYWWQARSFQNRFGQLSPNVHLNEAGFRWGSEGQAGGEFSRQEIVSFRLEQLDGNGATHLILILPDDFESQPILLCAPVDEETVRNWLQARWSLAETPSPRTSPVGVRTVRLPVYLESHQEQGEWHWEGSAVGLMSLAEVFRSAAEELALAPAGARPKVLEVVGTRRDGSEMLLAVDHQPWQDELTLATSADQWRKLADDLENALTTAEQNQQSDFELEFDLGTKHPGKIYGHLRGE